jgi:hypothetical protein
VPALKAELGPADVAVDGAGHVVESDGLSDRVRVAAVTTGTFYGQQMTAGDIYTVAGSGVDGFSGDGADDLLVADVDNDRVRMVTG